MKRTEMSSKRPPKPRMEGSIELAKQVEKRRLEKQSKKTQNKPKREKQGNKGEPTHAPSDAWQAA